MFGTRRQSLMGLIAVAACVVLSACGEVQESEVSVTVVGSAATVTSAPPEATTSTTTPTTAPTGAPGRDPDGCGGPGPEHVVLLADPDDTATEPCPVGAHQRLKFYNITQNDITLDWAGDTIPVASGATSAVPARVGEVIDVGVYKIQADPASSGPQIRLVDPAEGFGAATIRLRSFGDLRPGQKLSEVEAALGRSVTVQRRTDQAACSPAWVTGDPYSPMLAVQGDAVDPTLTRVEATTATQKTFSGIGVGDSVEALRGAYGDRLASQVVDGGAEQFVFEPNDSRDQDFRLVFDTKQGVVTAIRIGMVDSVKRSGTCP